MTPVCCASAALADGRALSMSPCNRPYRVTKPISDWKSGDGSPVKALRVDGGSTMGSWAEQATRTSTYSPKNQRPVLCLWMDFMWGSSSFMSWRSDYLVLANDAEALIPLLAIEESTLEASCRA